MSPNGDEDVDAEDDDADDDDDDDLDDDDDDDDNNDVDDDWIVITSCSADSIKVGFDNGVARDSSSQLSNLRPDIVQWKVSKHL